MADHCLRRDAVPGDRRERPNPDLGSGLNLSHFDAITVAASHELAEAVTDTIPGYGWYDATNNGEIGDLINAVDCVDQGFVVQKEVTKDLQPIVPRGSISYSYFAGVVGSPSDPVAAFVPTTNDYNANLGAPNGVNRLVPGAAQTTDQTAWDPSQLYAGTNTF